MDLLKDRPRDRKRDPDCPSDQDEQLKDVVHRHAASPLSRLRPGEQNNKVSQPPEACRRKLDHLYAISTSSPPLGGVFIVAYFCRQYNQELQLSPLKTTKSLPAARLLPQETSAANAVCLYVPSREKRDTGASADAPVSRN